MALAIVVDGAGMFGILAPHHPTGKRRAGKGPKLDTQTTHCKTVARIEEAV